MMKTFLQLLSNLSHYKWSSNVAFCSYIFKLYWTEFTKWQQHPFKLLKLSTHVLYTVIMLCSMFCNSSQKCFKCPYIRKNRWHKCIHHFVSCDISDCAVLLSGDYKQWWLQRPCYDYLALTAHTTKWLMWLTLQETLLHCRSIYLPLWRDRRASTQHSMAPVLPQPRWSLSLPGSWASDSATSALPSSCRCPAAWAETALRGKNKVWKTCCSKICFR